MDTNTDIITKFYTAFQKKDAEGMVKHYANNISFEDPAFGNLNGDDAKNMWRMLCSNTSEIEIDFKIMDSHQNQVTAHWVAKYTFSKTGRNVINKIDATFILENQQIVSHVDVFNLWTWSKQAMGPMGWLFGWSDYFRKKLQQTTSKSLSKYSAKP